MKDECGKGIRKNATLNIKNLNTNVMKSCKMNGHTMARVGNRQLSLMIEYQSSSDV